MEPVFPLEHTLQNEGIDCKCIQYRRYDSLFPFKMIVRVRKG